MSEEMGKTEKFVLNIDEGDYDKKYVEPSAEQTKKSKKKTKKKRRWLRNLIWATVIVGISATLAICCVLVFFDMYPITETNAVDIEIHIPQGATVEEIANLLHSEHEAENGKKYRLIEYPLAFRLVSKLSEDGRSYNYGAYTISTADGYQTIINNLKTPSTRHVKTMRITFKEGLTLGQMADAYADKMVDVMKEADDDENDLKKMKESYRNKFLKACEKDYNLEFEKYIQPNVLRLKKYEGYLFPDTYEFFVDDEAEVVVRRMLTEFQKRIVTPLFEQIGDSGMTFDQVITLASIVQNEAGDTGQLAGVAGVFRNRLANSDKFPRLESDPTKLYARTVVSVYSNDEEQIRSYNTYEGFGLPPGPISSPSFEAVKAVLNPEKSDFFYFCHNIETKEVFYGKTLAEHEQNLYKAGIWR